MADRLRVLLLFGGRSAEHDVSRVSAVAAARALDPHRYEIVPVGITRDGAWTVAEGARRALERGRDELPEAFEIESEIEGAIGGATEGDGGTGLVALGRDLSGGTGLAAVGGRVDVVVPMLHGPYGEDGTVQGLLELAGLPYVGSGVVGSAVGMDKVMTKRALRAEGLPVASTRVLREWDVDDDALDRAAADLGFPCFVKPANLGSSVGVSKARDREELARAAETALRFDEWILIEEAIVGREIEVAVLGDRPPEASRPGEIVPGDEFYSYDDKYENQEAELHVPARLSPEQEAEVRDLAVRAFLACGCEAMARVDFLFEEGGRGFLVNEVNTIPGFTPVSMYPMLWEASGLAYPALLDRLVELALERHERRRRRAGRQRDG